MNKQQSVASYRRAFNVAEDQLHGGTINLTAVLLVEQNLFTAEATLTQDQLTQLTDGGEPVSGARWRMGTAGEGFHAGERTRFRNKGILSSDGKISWDEFKAGCAKGMVSNPGPTRA